MAVAYSHKNIFARALTTVAERYIVAATLEFTGGLDMDSDDLNKIRDLHNKWLAGEGGERADLIGANLRGADLRDSRGVLHPPINDPRGYRCVAVWHPDGWMIAAGCRYFTVEGALAHWGADYRGDRAIGDAYLFAVRLVAERPTEETRGVL